MSLNNYAGLIVSIQNWMEDNDTEFVGQIDDIINLGELRVLRDLDLAIFRRVDSTAVMVIGTTTVTKPTIASPNLLVATKEIWLTGGALTGPVFLQNKAMEVVLDYNAGATNGVPQYYAEQDETTWVFGRPPNATYAVNVRYLSRPNFLRTANQTNWLSDHVYDLLFKAILSEAEAFLKGEERKVIWETDYLRSLPKVRKELYPLFGNQYDSLGLVGVAQNPRSVPE